MKKHDNRNRLTKEFGAGNGKVVFTLPLGGYMMEGKVVLRGVVKVVNAGAAGAPIGENPAGLISRVIMEAVPRDGSPYIGGKMKNLSPRSILRNRVYDKGQFVGDQKTPAGLTGAAGDFPIYLELPLRFALPTLKKPVDTSLNCNEYKSIQVIIETGGKNTLFSGNEGAFDFSGLFLDWIDRREDMAGDTHILYEEDTYVQLQGNNQRFIVESLPGGGNYLDMLIIAQAGATEALSDAIVQKVAIDGSVTQYEKTGDDIKSDGLEFIDKDQAQTGLYFLPFSPDGLLYGANPVASPHDLGMVLDVKNPSGAGNDSLLIRTRRVYWPEQFKPAAVK